MAQPETDADMSERGVLEFSASDAAELGEQLNEPSENEER